MKNRKSLDVLCLRRLRTKVHALAEHRAKKPASWSLPFEEDITPKIYAIHDAFKDIALQVRTSAPEHNDRVPSLVALCSIVVGNSMEEMRRSAEDDRDEEEEDLDILRPLYDAVPAEHRRWTIMSHALSIILKTTDNNPTLLKLLLDVALDNGLLYESDTLLRGLLRVASTPASNGEPPLCHPIHSGFLIDIRTRWSSAGRLDIDFFEILSTVVTETDSPATWSSCALQRMIQDQCKRDPLLLTRLASSIFYHSQYDKGPTTRTYKREMQRQNNTSGRGADANLHIWLNSVFSLLFSSKATDSTPFPHVIRFLSSCSGNCLPRANEETTGATICIISHLLFACAPALSSWERRFLTNILRQTEPSTKTFSLWITAIFSQAGSTSILACKQEVQNYASHLVSVQLLRMEASLWGCALRHIDAGLLSLCPPEDVRAYRTELMVAVEESEARYCKTQDGEYSALFGSWARQSKSPIKQRIMCPSSTDIKTRTILQATVPQTRKRRRLESPKLSFVLSEAFSNREVVHARPSLTSPVDSDAHFLAIPSSDDLDLFR